MDFQPSIGGHLSAGKFFFPVLCGLDRTLVTVRQHGKECRTDEMTIAEHLAEFSKTIDRSGLVLYYLLRLLYLVESSTSFLTATCIKNCWCWDRTYPRIWRIAYQPAFSLTLPLLLYRILQFVNVPEGHEAVVLPYPSYFICLLVWH